MSTTTPMTRAECSALCGQTAAAAGHLPGRHGHQLPLAHDMRMADGRIAPWLPSQPDVLASDWYIVEDAP